MVRFFDGFGRIGRAGYALRLVAGFGASVVGIALTSVVHFGDSHVGSLLQLSLTLAVGAVFLALQISSARKRLHDLGASGWWALILLTPFAVFLVLVCLVASGSPQPNKYGLAHSG